MRAERPKDVAAIREVLLAGFPTEAESRLVDLLRDADHLTVSLVAEVNGRIVGHVAFSPVSTATSHPGVGLAPLAVTPPHRGRGVAGELVERGLASCASLGFGWAVALGAPKYYSRFGFGPAADSGLVDEYGGGPAFQVIELSAGSLPVDAGLVAYAAEFIAVR